MLLVLDRVLAYLGAAISGSSGFPCPVVLANRFNRGAGAGSVVTFLLGCFCH